MIVLRFNPLDPNNLRAAVADALLRTPPRPLGDVQDFEGAGIYALYYSGPFPAYAELAARNRNGVLKAPIYVGKAVPAGARKGLDLATSTKALSRRLREHAESITATKNLSLADFQARFLVVDDIWIPLGESLLIARFSPIWNHLVEGFGNHDPGKGRHNGMRPRWDALHPGRAWAAKCQPRPESAEQISADVESFLRSFSFPE